jgi:hypothetical protein
MEDFRAFEDAAGFPGEEEPTMEAPPEIGVDERRMHVRAYNYWVSLLGGRPYPSIRDLEPHNLDDFGPHSVLLDFTAGSENPAVPFIGRELREECDLLGEVQTIADVPPRSLLSRLTDHYLQIIANRAPIGFEAEFVGHRGVNTMYRGILMPLSSDGDAIDYIYGVINWKEVADQQMTANIAREALQASGSSAMDACPVWADGPNAEPIHILGDGPAAEIEEDEDQHAFELALGPDAGLADRLCVARETAEAVKNADARSRAALYRALGQAYDFALAAEAEPEDYAEILADAGLKAQARAPMTPIVKLIFGVGHDKARLTEYAAALSYAKREAVGEGAFTLFLEGFAGGLKGVVQAERKTRRPDAKPDTSEKARATLRQARPLAYVPAIAGDEEFVLLVARREDDGRLAVVAPVEPDQGLIERAIRKSAA